MNHKYTIPQVQFSLAFKDTTKTSIIKAFSLPHHKGTHKITCLSSAKIILFMFST